MTARRRLPPGARWITLPSGEKRVELVVDIGPDPATGRRRQQRKRFKTVDDALTAYTETKGTVRSGTSVGTSTLTVEAACVAWLASRRKIRASTLVGYGEALKPVVAVYGQLAVQKLAKKDLDDPVALLVAGKLTRTNGKPIRPWKPRTVNLMLFVIRTVLEDLVRQGVLVRNVAAFVDRLTQPKTEMQTYTAAEVRKVLAAARADRLEPVWHLALCGLRRGEICRIRWSDIDLRGRTITIEETNVVVDGQASKSQPKSAKGRRTLPLTDTLVLVLKRAKPRQAAEREEAGAHYEETDYLVVDELGLRPNPETISDKWDRHAKLAGVRRIRLHDAPGTRVAR